MTRSQKIAFLKPLSSDHVLHAELFYKALENVEI